jgi:hypothetical protein
LSAGCHLQSGAANQLASLSAGSAIEQMLADYQVMRGSGEGLRALWRVSGVCASLRHFTCAGKQTLAATSTTWK